MLSLLLAIALDAALAPRGETASPSVSAQCTAIVGKGRIRCILDLSSEREIRFADVVVRESPPFADPLRGRLGPLEASVRTTRSWKWEFAFAGQKKGEGEALIEVRSVLCEGARCEPHTTTTKVALRVE